MEVLEKTGMDSAYSAKSLCEPETIDDLTKQVRKKSFWNAIQNKDYIEATDRKGFNFKYVTKQRYKSIGKYASEVPLAFFSNLDADGFTQTTRQRRRSSVALLLE